MAIDLNSVEYASLDGKFIVIKDVSASADVYYPQGFAYLIFGITNNNIYRITLDQVADPTKGDLVVTASADGKTVTWQATHTLDNPYETNNLLQQSGVVGSDVGIPLIEALYDHIVNTYNLATFDPNIVSTAELVYKALDVAPATNVESQAEINGFSVTAD